MGRMLQRIALLILPGAMVLQLWPGPGGRPVLSVGQMLAAMVFGAALFWLGWVISGWENRQE